MSLTPVRGPVVRPQPRPKGTKGCPGVRNPFGFLYPVRPAAASARAAAPAPAPAPVNVPAKAGSPLLVEYYMYQAYKTSKQNAASFKAGITLYAAALNEARIGSENAQKALDAAKAAEAKADETAVAPFNAAKKAHADAHAKYQAPVDALSKQLRQAWTELDFAVHPGRSEADARDGEAGRVRARIEELDDQIRDRYTRLSQLSPYAYDYGTWATSLRDQIRDLEDQQRPLFQQYVALSDKGDAARAPQADPNDAKVKAARAKVTRLEAELTAAQQTYRTETDKTLLAVDREQQRYNRAMADFRANAASAERDQKAAQALFQEVQTAYDKQEPKYNIFRRLGWWLFSGLNAHKLWETEKRKALGLPEPVKKKK